jgi:hypothetical protein
VCYTYANRIVSPTNHGYSLIDEEIEEEMTSGEENSDTEELTQPQRTLAGKKGKKAIAKKKIKKEKVPSFHFEFEDDEVALLCLRTFMLFHTRREITRGKPTFAPSSKILNEKCLPLLVLKTTNKRRRS